MPLSANGLWEAEITAPARRSALGDVGHAPASAPRRAARRRRPRRRSRRPARPRAAGPERRVSRPITTRSPPSTRAAARPRARASSGVSSVLATPRTPSVPKRRAMRRARRDQRLEYCGALRAFLRPYFLLSFSRASRVRRPAFFSVGPQLGIELDERPGDAHAQRAGLAGDAAAVDRGVDVVDLVGAREPQRLGDDHALGRRREVVARTARRLTVMVPVPGRRRTRATASLRRPVVWVSGLVTIGSSLVLSEPWPAASSSGCGLLGGVRVRRARRRP